MGIALACRCGKLQGELDGRRVVARIVCYCKDCRAFARFASQSQDGRPVLDAAGGSEVMAASPAGVRFTSGIEHLACISLSPKGMVRWYADCCHTPIANTPRDPRLAYASVLRACLAVPDETLAGALGASRVAVQTDSALAPVRAMPLATALTIAKMAGMMLRGRLGGSYRDNPFFPGGQAWLRAPRVLSLDERAALTF